MAIARALAMNPAVIVCDEPTSALDVTTQARVLTLFKELQEATGVAYLFISHDLGVVNDISDRIAVLYRGEIVEIGEAKQVALAPRNEYTRRLQMAAPVADPKKQRARRKLRLELLAAGPHDPGLGSRRSDRRSDRPVDRIPVPLVTRESDMALSAAPTAPRFEHRTDAGPVLGLGSPTPRLSWTVPQADPGWEQTAYEVEVVRNATREAYRVSRPGPGAGALAGATAGVPRARRRSGSASPAGATWSPWSDAAIVEAGLLRPSDWSASFISPVGVGEKAAERRFCRRIFEVPGEVRSARLYATAHGVYAPSINGRRVDDTVLAPGWTSYEHRLRYHAYDVTHLVQSGENIVEVLLGNGWYRGRLGYTNDRALYGHRLALLGPARGHHHRRRRPRPGHRPTPGAPGRARSSRTTCTTARRPTCGSAGDPAAYGRRSRCSRRT